MPGRHQPSRNYLGEKPRPGGAIIGLLALLIYFLLPLVYYVHLLNSPVITTAVLTIGLADSLSHAEGPLPAPHDAEQCPICQAAENFEDYACYSILLTLYNAYEVRMAWHGDFSSNEQTSYLSFFIPRAPPISL